MPGSDAAGFLGGYVVVSAVLSPLPAAVELRCPMVVPCPCPPLESPVKSSLLKESTSKAAFPISPWPSPSPLVRDASDPPAKLIGLVILLGTGSSGFLSFAELNPAGSTVIDQLLRCCCRKVFLTASSFSLPEESGLFDLNGSSPSSSSSSSSELDVVLPLDSGGGEPRWFEWATPWKLKTEPSISSSDMGDIGILSVGGEAIRTVFPDRGGGRCGSRHGITPKSK